MKGLLTVFASLAVFELSETAEWGKTKSRKVDKQTNRQTDIKGFYVRKKTEKVEKYTSTQVHKQTLRVLISNRVNFHI